VGDAHFDIAARRLTRHGVVVPLEHRATELLILLLGRAGETVPKNEILDRLWPGRMVTEASLTKCVRQLRLAIGDDDHAVVRTVHGQGFRIEAVSAVAVAATTEAAEAAAAAPVRRGEPGPRWRHFVAVVLMVGVAGALWRGSRAIHARHEPPEAAHRLYIKGMQDWAQRTPASLNAAVDEFSSAVRIDPDYADAYMGLANTYNLLREYAGMPDAQAFGLARKAAEQALRLNPDLAGAHAARAFVLFWGDWDFSGAITEYERALRLEPDNPGIHHWYATSLDNIGDRARAMAHIDRALELAPESRAIRADRGLILFHAGHVEEARGILAGLAATDPAFASPHAYLSEISLATGDDAGFLREAGLFAQAVHSADKAAIVGAARAGEQSGGHAGMVRGLLAGRLAAFSTGGAAAADVASAYALAGDTAAALRMLSLAIDRHELAATYILNDPGLRLLVPDPAAAPLLARLHVAGRAPG
jgi:DNA-binding winged helix-turn-helix (wHTH) protein/tetratricopeptide (TPR) repeat protein